jgi:hypothetical protein
LKTSCISSDVCNLLDEPGEQHPITTEWNPFFVARSRV